MTRQSSGRPGPTRLLDRIEPIAWIAAGAILLRLLLFTGRGAYVAFDEGWYLLLGRNVWDGDGFRLSGLRHVALSPLFPLLAGGVDVLVDDIVWAGRLVAAVTSGLLVVPCWSILRRFATPRSALLGAGFVALLPSLAPFVVAYWVGWDLWVGAEPVLHLFVYAGIALFLRALEDGGIRSAAACGACFALAYLARPEAIVVFAVLGLGAAAFALWRGRPRPVQFMVCAAAFVVLSAPYWLYLHDALGRWTITGRAVTAASGSSGQDGATPRNPIEQMLWQDDESRYVGTLYALNPGGTELENSYWGVQEERGTDAAPAVVRDSLARGAAAQDGRRGAVASPGEAAGAAEAPSPLGLYVHAMLTIVPWFIWPLVLVGLVAPGGRRPLELLVIGPLLGASVIIAIAVATDPRTQLVLAPLAALYAARGVTVTGSLVDRRTSIGFRPGFVTAALASVLCVLLLGTSARRLYMSLAVGSPHHIVAAENERVGEALAGTIPPDQAVMSWH
ncbi:MAG: ArnT family glycosyltransferase, partial [Longimicrobiales bacterium]